MQIYNAGGLDNNKRFVRAVFVGLAGSRNRYGSRVWSCFQCFTD
jgi:heterodisulfide reductase subunit C